LSRATALKCREPRSLCSYSAHTFGAHTPRSLNVVISRGANDGGITPTMVVGWPLMRTTRPTSAGSAPKRCAHVP
jgi:hypothetical protein